MEINIGALVVEEDVILGSLQLDVVKLTPELEDLEVTPSTEEQNFKSTKYGYANVKVEGSPNLVPENIKKDVEIFGVKGIGQMADLKITNASHLFHERARTDYLNEILSLCYNVTSCRNMFYGCTTLESLDLSNFDTSKVDNMEYMFHGCSALESLDVSNFDTSKVTNMNGMFRDCSKLRSLDVSNFDTSEVGQIGYMFYGCATLESLDLSNFIHDSAFSSSQMFRGCTNLKHLDIRKFTFPKTSSTYYKMFTDVPTDCEIIVKDDAVKVFMTTNFPEMTNVKTVAELTAE